MPEPSRPSEEKGMPLPAPRKERTSKRIRRLLFGAPLESDQMAHTLLPKFLALPVFASDAISSCAYATQEIILVLGIAGLVGTPVYAKFTVTTAVAIIALLVVVVTSYWQTIFAYPKGGGSYIVTSDNLGVRRVGKISINWGLIAGAALLIDYVLTVSVSIAAGIQNLANIPFMEQYFHVKEYIVPYCALAIALLTLANLRGLKESGALFALFTYGFVAICVVMIFLGLVGPSLGWVLKKEDIEGVRDAYKALNHPEHSLTGLALILLALQAFASGCTAMTGVEAVCDGIPAFKEPKSKNAAQTLLMMGVILGTIFIGISILASKFGIVYYGEYTNAAGVHVEGAPAVIDQISGAIFGKTGAWSFAYLLAQFATAGILVLAANTAYADFPRLASFMARDRFLPKQLANVGDKLVFNNGIVLLGLFAGVLIWIFHGKVDSLIPLYAVGVFLAFTLSQSAMVVHWTKIKTTAWRRKATINGVGAFATGLVLFVIAFEKFMHGAWAIIVLLFAFYFMFQKIHQHYADVAQQLKLDKYEPPKVPLKNTVLVLIPTLHKGVAPALEYAQSLSPDCRAVHIETDPENTPRLRERWEAWGQDIPLVILHSSYRSLVGPIMRYLDAVQVERRNHIVTVVVPEFVPTKWWHKLLHGNSGALLRIALLGRRDVVVTSVRYYLMENEEIDGAALQEEVDQISIMRNTHNDDPEH